MTARTSIGGSLNYQELAMLHRPQDPLRLAAEVHRLHSDQHLTAIDISTALRIDHAQVINILASRNNQEPNQ